MNPTGLKVRRILVGVSGWSEDDASGLDICPHDQHAARQAIWLAERVGAEVELLHVVDFLDEHVTAGDDVFSAATGALAEPLVALESGAGQGVKVTHRFAKGKPWVELLRRAHEIDADLLVVSPRRELGLGQRILFGRTTWRLIRKAACAVWVVHPEAPLGVKRVLALLDNSEVSPRVVAAALGISEAAGAQRHALHCMEYPDDMALRRLPEARRVVANYHRDVRERAAAKLDSLLEGATWSVHLSHHWVVKAAPALVKDEAIDCVVVAAMSHPRLAGMLLGSTAEKMVERLHASCWIVRPEGWAGGLNFDA